MKFELLLVMLCGLSGNVLSKTWSICRYKVGRLVLGKSCLLVCFIRLHGFGLQDVWFLFIYFYCFITWSVFKFRISLVNFMVSCLKITGEIITLYILVQHLLYRVHFLESNLISDYVTKLLQNKKDKSIVEIWIDKFRSWVNYTYITVFYLYVGYFFGLRDGWPLVFVNDHMLVDHEFSDSHKRLALTALHVH
jgi:hypothetical protein